MPVTNVTTILQNNNLPIQINTNGEYFISFKGQLRSKCAISYSNTENYAPAGILSFDFEKNGGDPPAVLDLSIYQNTFEYSVPVPSIHLEVTGLPEYSKLLLYFS
jgi:hypothetical protein